MVQSDVARIIETYRRNGRFDVRVTPKIIELPNNRVDLVFEINEGDKTGVKKIIFAGNRAYSDYRLKDVIKTTETNFLSFLKTSDVYDADRVEADRDLLRRFYLKHGFADVRVVSAVGEFDPGLKGFIVTYTIEEGDQYRFGRVDMQSNVRNVDAGSIQDKLKAKAGQRLQCRGGGKNRRGDLGRGGQARLSVRDRAAARRRDFETRRINVVLHRR